jgi:isopenicillin-N N-acyltransferase-like protein
MSDHFPFYEFAGTPYELGRAHGEQLAPAVRRQVDDVLHIAAQAGQDRPAALAWSMELLPRIERLNPALVDELRGLADGAGIALAEAIAIQSRPGTGRMLGGCTSLAASSTATSDGSPIGAQTRDLYHGFRERMVITLLRPRGGTPLLMHTVPGELGGTGLNGHGLALFANSIWARAGRTWMGTPLLRRTLLETPDAEAAAECVRAMDGPAVGNFLLVDAAGRIRNCEIMPEGPIVAAQDGGTYAHTNHCLDVVQRAREERPYSMPGTVDRCRRMEAALAAADGRLDVAAVKAALSLHEPQIEAICRHATGPGEYETAAASIVETAMRRLHISYGPPCEGRFKTYSLT